MIKKVILISSFLIYMIAVQALASPINSSKAEYNVALTNHSTQTVSSQSNHTAKTVNVPVLAENKKATEIPLPAYLVPGLIGAVSILFISSYWLFFRKRTIR